MTTRDEILGRGFFDVFPNNPTAGGATNLRASFERVLTMRLPNPAGLIVPFDSRRNPSTLEERWWSSKNTPVIGPRDEVAYIIHAVEDVTEKHRLEEERQQLAALLASANEFFDQASDSIFVADMNGRFTQVNASACKMLGYDREELIGKTVVDIIPPEDRARPPPAPRPGRARPRPRCLNLFPERAERAQLVAREVVQEEAPDAVQVRLARLGEHAPALVRDLREQAACVACAALAP